MSDIINKNVESDINDLEAKKLNESIEKVSKYIIAISDAATMRMNKFLSSYGLNAKISVILIPKK